MAKDQVVTADEAEAEAAMAEEGEAGAVEQETESVEELSPEELVLVLEDARSKADDHWNQLVRSKAEMDNLRKRQERDLTNAHKFALERFVNELLPVRDSMELGLVAAGEEGADIDKLREGTELTLKLLGDVMEKFDVVQINPRGSLSTPICTKRCR